MATQLDTPKGTVTTIREYLEATGKMMGEHNENAKKYYDWMLENFKEMKVEKAEGQALKFIQKVIDKIKVSEGDDFPRNKECFFTCNLLCQFSKGKIKYIEGQCWDIIPFELENKPG